jgi:hydroxymethylbilane synthase
VRGTTPLRLGTRRSLLARTQSELVAQGLREALDRDVELVEVVTEGDVSGAAGRHRRHRRLRQCAA